MYQPDIHKQTITIDGVAYSSDSFRGGLEADFILKSEFHHQLFLFLEEWFSEAPTLTVKTSGSTGIPKEIQVEKDRMIQSAHLTCSFLGLQKGDTALLCMPLQYIAGKMMVVRSLICGLDLHVIPPSGNPLKDTDIHFDFAAMIPLQVFNALQSDIETQRLQQIRNLIIGGGAIDADLEEKIKDFPNAVYSTYGMTETLSHIALRKISGQKASLKYRPFDTVSLSLSEEGTLVIKAPPICKETLYTNDVAEIYEDGTFRIIGRKDNIINSGSIKIQIEKLEELLKPLIAGSFAITSIPDPKFGEIIVLVSEDEIDITALSGQIPDYYIPKRSIVISKIPRTETGKISRAGIKKLASDLLK